MGSRINNLLDVYYNLLVAVLKKGGGLTLCYMRDIGKKYFLDKSYFPETIATENSYPLTQGIAKSY